MFLATTAIEEFWQKHKKIFFLGQWCKLYNRKAEWSMLDYVDLEFIWDKQKTEEAYYYCDKVYERMLDGLTERLNSIHGIKEDKRYYRIILGNWLVHFIHQLYDKYLSIKKALERDSGLDTWILDPAQYYIPIEYADYMIKIRDDRYNLQIYSRILKELGFNFCARSLNHPILQNSLYQINNKFKDRIDALSSRIQNILNAFFYKESITITAPYLSYNTKIRLIIFFLKGKFKYIFDDMRYAIKIGLKIDHALRNNVELNLNSGEFEKILAKIIFKELPILFLEGFKSFKEKIALLSIQKSGVFFTANALHSNYIFKFFVAGRYKDIKILNAQHGGGFGTDKVNVMEEYEKSVCDIFYTWGWGEGGNIKYLPSPKLYNQRVINRSKDVLFVMDSQPQYVHRLLFHPVSAFMIDYIDSSIHFLKSANFHKNILIRIHPADRDYKWFTKERLIDAGISSRFISPREKFYKILTRCYIFATNNLGTPYLEALAINKPTIIFLSEDIFHLRNTARPYFDMLREVKILHDSPLSAAQHLNAVYADVNKWWLQAPVQKARLEFVHRYARTDSNWMREWMKELQEALP